MNLTHRISSISWWKWIIAMDLMLVIYASLYRYTPYFPGKYYFNLAYEMNFAVWWSGICLLTASLLSYECYCARKDETKISWLIISILLIALSLDEIGSLHEDILFQGSWFNYIPYALVGSILLIYSCTKLILNRNTRKSGLLIVSAFVLFGSVVFRRIY